MIAIVTVLSAFPLGFFLRNRLAAYVGYLALFGYSFSFQNYAAGFGLVTLGHGLAPAGGPGRRDRRRWAPHSDRVRENRRRGVGLPAGG